VRDLLRLVLHDQRVVAEVVVDVVAGPERDQLDHEVFRAGLCPGRALIGSRMSRRAREQERGENDTNQGGLCAAGGKDTA
jgi:hypothetical protein